MAFPTTGILDDFDRANEGPPPSANWTGAIVQSDRLVVSSNVCTSNSAAAGGDAAWNVSTFGPDSETFFTITDASDALYLFGRVVNQGAGTSDGYATYMTAIGIAQISRVDNGVLTTLGANVSFTTTNGDKVGLECLSDAISFYADEGGGWGLVASRTDATYSGAGRIGAGVDTSFAKFNDFGGGTVSAGVDTGLAWIRA